jgi:hypothetical protein
MEKVEDGSAQDVVVGILRLDGKLIWTSDETEWLP